MNILVTGGSGFLGTRLIPRLVRDRDRVLALSRSASSDAKLQALGAEPVRGDMEGSLTLPTVDAVVHAAAHFRFAGSRSAYFRANVEGTRRLLQAAANAGATRFVYVSAGAVVMDDAGSAIRHVDETVPTFPSSFSGYIASKSQGEAAVLAADKPGFRTIALRPPAIWGPGDMFSRELPKAIRSGQFAFIERGDYDYVTCHVDNVVEAICCALRSDAGGRAYFIHDDETVTFRTFVEGLARANGLSIDKLRSMPYGLAFFIGRMMEFFSSLTFAGKDPPLSRTMVRMIGREFTTNDAAARRDLGYRPTITRAEGLAGYLL